VPLGYQLDAEGKLEPSTRLVEPLGITEADLIHDLYQRLAEGSTGIAEAKRLNALGVPINRVYANGRIVENPGRWLPERLLRLIKSETYIGTHHFRSRFGTITSDVPSLVDRALWERANQQVARNQKRPKGNAKRVYLLTGLIVCGQCSAAFTGQLQYRRNGNHHVYYRCGARSRAHQPPAARCRMRTVHAARLEEAVWGKVQQYSQHPGEALDEARRQLAARLEQTDDASAQEQYLTQQIAATYAKREEFLTLFRRGKLRVEEVERELDTLEQESATLQQERDALRTRTRVTSVIQEQYLRAERMLERLQERVREVERTNDQVLKKQVIADVVADITVQHDTINVRFVFAEERIALKSTLPTFL
jgi:hypothetical protein